MISLSFNFSLNDFLPISVFNQSNTFTAISLAFLVKATYLDVGVLPIVAWNFESFDSSYKATPAVELMLLPTPITISTSPSWLISPPIVATSTDE